MRGMRGMPQRRTETGTPTAGEASDETADVRKRHDASEATSGGILARRETPCKRGLVVTASEFISSAWPYAACVLVVLAVIALAWLIVVLARAAKSMKHINTITAEAEEQVTPSLKRVEPLIDRAELTVDTLNLELLRVDAILEDVEQVTDVAGSAAETASTLANAPTNAVAALAEKLRTSIGGRHSAKMKEGRLVKPIGSGATEGAAQDDASASKKNADDDTSAAKTGTEGGESPEAGNATGDASRAKGDAAQEDAANATEDGGDIGDIDSMPANASDKLAEAAEAIKAADGE